MPTEGEHIKEGLFKVAERIFDVGVFIAIAILIHGC